MILRKPYALLVKYFRQIHLALAFLIGYLIYRSILVLNFFNEYIKVGWKVYTEDLVTKYGGVLIYVILIAIFLILIAIVLLMKYKEKPRKFYLVAIGCYVIILIGFIVATNDLSVIQDSLISQRKIRLTRDIFLITSLFQYLVIVVCLARAVGFNVKQFNFSADKKELQIEEKDHEEFEVNVLVDTQILKRSFKKQIRELKYMFYENMFIILIIFGGILVYIILMVVLNFQVYNKIYKENKNINVQEFTMKINNSYITSYDYKGNLISKGKTYVIVDVTLKNNVDAKIKLDTESFVLDNNNVYRYTNVGLYGRFADIGTGYKEQIIEPKDEKNYILVFEYGINDKSYKDLYLIYSSEKNKSYGKRIKKVELNPQNLENVKKMGSKNITEKLNLKDSILENSNFQIQSYDIIQSFIFNYQSCIKNVCTEKSDYIVSSDYTLGDKTILKLKANLDIDKEISNQNMDTIYEFIEKFGTLIYVVDNETKNTKNFINQTPDDYQGDESFIEVLKNLGNASKITLQINIRNKQYDYILK